MGASAHHLMMQQQLQAQIQQAQQAGQSTSTIAQQVKDQFVPHQ
jgi:hypothetical protein